jgi:hypothetical protein
MLQLRLWQYFGTETLCHELLTSPQTSGLH